MAVGGGMADGGARRGVPAAGEAEERREAARRAAAGGEGGSRVMELLPSPGCALAFLNQNYKNIETCVNVK